MTKQNKKQKAVQTTLIILLIFMVLIGLFFVFLEPIKTLIRGHYTEAVKEEFRKGETTVTLPKTDALSIDGENGETEIAVGKFFVDVGSMADDYETVTLLGLLEIPCIDVEEPVFDGVSTVALRYGSGKLRGTAYIGEPGLCSIWGHRTLGGSSHFDRLQELQDHIGEEVYITTTDNYRHVYQIVDTVYAKDGDLMPWMYKDTYEDETVAIITCGYGEDPVRPGTWYAYNTEFIVVCKPVRVEPPEFE